MHLQSPPLTIGGAVLESDYLDILGVRFDSKMTFDSKMSRSWRAFHDRLVLWRCFWDFVLSVVEYCFAVLRSAADTHLKLLCSVVSVARF